MTSLVLYIWDIKKTNKQNKINEQPKISKSKHVDLEDRVVTRGKGTEAGTLNG